MTTPTTTATTSPVQPPVDRGHICVNARLLFPYLTNGHVSLAEWEDSLDRMAADPGFIAMGYSLLTGSRGGLFLSLNFAMFFIIRASTTPKGAVARVILDEALEAAEDGDMNYIVRILAQYYEIGRFAGLVQARLLHAFLAPNTVFDDWFDRQKQSCRLVYGRDFARVGESDSAPPKLYRRNVGKGEFYFCDAAAEQVILNNPTPRGLRAGEHINDPSLRWK